MELQNNYHESKLEVKKFYPGTFSHQLVCLCKTAGVPQQLENAYLYKKVNYYKFRAFVEQTMRVANFNDWYFDFKSTSVFTFALSEYLNTVEGRETYYNVEGEAHYKLSETIAMTAANNNAMHKILGK